MSALKDNMQKLFDNGLNSVMMKQAAKAGVPVKLDLSPGASSVSTLPSGQTVKQGDMAPVKSSSADGLSGALDSIGKAYAARETNRELNKNPPYWLYGLFGLGLVGLYIVVRR